MSRHLSFFIKILFYCNLLIRKLSSCENVRQIKIFIAGKERQNYKYAPECKRHFMRISIKNRFWKKKIYTKCLWSGLEAMHNQQECYIVEPKKGVSQNLSTNKMVRVFLRFVKLKKNFQINLVFLMLWANFKLRYYSNYKEILFKSFSIFLWQQPITLITA